MPLLLTLCPIPDNAAATLARLFDTHGSGRIGSPIAAAPTNRRRLSSRAGSFSVSPGRPLPGRRTVPADGTAAASSFKPRPMVLRAIPVALCAAAIPPCPAVQASAAANRRRDRSSKPPPNAVKRSRIDASFTIPRV
jgi:hypothetical protein